MTPAPGTPAADMEAATAMAQRIVAGDHQGGWTELCVLSRGISAYQDALAAERTERKAARQLANIAKACLADAERDCKAETAEKERLAGRLEIAERNVAANADLAGRWIAEHDRQQERARTLADALRRLLEDVQDYPAWERPCAAVIQARAALAALPPSSAPCSAEVATQGKEATEDRQASGWRPIETAQMDGHRILVGHVLGWTSIGSCRASGKWRHDDGSTATVAPTHWQPLPPPPALPQAEPAIDDDVTGRIRESCWGPPEGPLGDGPVATPIPKEK